MKKKMIMLGGLLAAVVVLLAVYGIAKNKKPVEEPAEEPNVITSEQKYEVLNYEPEDIESIDVGGRIKFLVGEKGIEIENVDLALMDNDLVVMMFNALVKINSDNEVGEFSGSDLAQFGLDAPQTTVDYTTKKGNSTLYIGNETPDGNYFYIKKADSDMVYTMGKMTGERIMQDITEMADLDIATLDPKGLTRLEVKQKDREDLSVTFDKDDEQANANLDKSGLQTLVMHKPVENLLVYPYNLETGLLYNYDKFKLTKMVELGDGNFAAYGLDEPQMTILMADLESGCVVAVGKLTEDGKDCYVTADGKKAVYTMPKDALDPFFNYNIVDFIQKFIALHFRDTLESVDIKSVYGDYTVEFKEEGDKKITVDENNVTRDKRREYINGKPADSEKFVDYYELLTGLTFDALDENEPKGEPQAVITYKMLDGSTDTTTYYNYDETFYTAVKEGSESGYNMLINKQQVKQAIEKANEVTALTGGSEG